MRRLILIVLLLIGVGLIVAPLSMSMFSRASKARGWSTTSGRSAPNGIGILLGHLWNRVPVTQLYDDANSPENYFPTFLFAS